MNHPRILGIGTANPPVRLTLEQSFHAAGYQGERIRKIFLNSDIDHRHFYLEGTLNCRESSDRLNQRYLRGAMQTGYRAIQNCVKLAGTSVQDVDLLAVCTGYVCPDVGSRLIPHMGFSNNLQRASIAGLGCAGALPKMQRAVDLVRANPGRRALMLAVAICSACSRSAELINDPSSGRHGENGTDRRHHQRPAQNGGRKMELRPRGRNPRSPGCDDES